MNLILHNGIFHTMDEDKPTARAVAINGSRGLHSKQRPSTRYGCGGAGWNEVFYITKNHFMRNAKSRNQLYGNAYKE